MSIKGVFIQDQRQPNEQVTISAEAAQLVVPPDSKSITFQIENGMMTRVPEHMQEAQAMSFKNYDFTISLDELLGRVETGVKKRNEMNLTELWESVKKSQGTLASYYGLELYQRLAFPSACLLLGLIGPPLGALFRQRSRLTGITIGVGIFLTYYVLMTAGRGLAESNRIPPSLAAWLPNLLCASLAVYLWWKMQTETPFIFDRLIDKVAGFCPKSSAEGKQSL
jgi:lipopolysaccharide export system permease protein